MTRKLRGMGAPLQIDEVSAPGDRGIIGMTFCPGKKENGLFSGLWDRDLESDLVLIKEWGAAALVTLMKQEELARLGVPKFPARVLALGLHWIHLPIKDSDMPDETFSELWCEGAPILHRLLDLGRGSFFTARGARPAGTVAAQLLVERGVGSELAISLVRAARPGTIDHPLNDSKGCGGVMRGRTGRSHLRRPLAGDPLRHAPLPNVRARVPECGHHSRAPVGLDSDRGLCLDHVRDRPGDHHRRSSRRCPVRTVRLVRAPGVPCRAGSALSLAGGPHEPSPEAVSFLGGGWTGEEALSIEGYAALVSEDDLPGGCGWRSTTTVTRTVPAPSPSLTHSRGVTVEGRHPSRT